MAVKIDYDKLVKVEGNGIVAYYEQPDKKGALEFKGFTKIFDKADRTGVFYDVRWGNVGSSSYDGVSGVISLPNYFENMIEVIANNELKDYIDANINDVSFYTSMENEDDRKFFRNINTYTLDYKPKENHIEYDYSDLLPRGYVKLYVNNNYVLVFDVCLDVFTSINRLNRFNSKFRDSDNVKALEIVYGYKWDLVEILAIAQYINGNCHSAYRELINLQDFFNTGDKKSIKIVLKDGSTYSLKPDYGLRVNQLFSYNDDDKRFELANNYNILPHTFVKKEKTIADLDYLLFGKKKYYVDVDKLAV